MSENNESKPWNECSDLEQARRVAYAIRDMLTEKDGVHLSDKYIEQQISFSDIYEKHRESCKDDEFVGSYISGILFNMLTEGQKDLAIARLKSELSQS